MIKKQQYPILEFDENRKGIIEPSEVLSPLDISEYCVVTFFRDVIAKYLQEGKLKKVTSLFCETMEMPIYEMMVDGKKINLVQGFLGAAGTAGVLEEMIAIGIKKIIVCGGAGGIRKDLTFGHLIVPTSAVRDEGLSYHYVAPARLIEADKNINSIIESELTKQNIKYIMGKTWTTDAIFRETKDKIAMRVDEGCLCVEMEAAAFMAVAQFRGVQLGQILYCGDDVSGDTWDKRQWNKREDIRENLVEVSLGICLKI